MSDKFEEAVKEYLQNPIFEWTTQEMIEGELLRFANWYHDKYLAGKGTCETCKHGGDCEVQCAGQGYVNALLGFGKFGCIYHVEKETK
jgi:hypothetical protein